jgi:hypothetical protein
MFSQSMKRHHKKQNQSDQMNDGGSAIPSRQTTPYQSLNQHPKKFQDDKVKINNVELSPRESEKLSFDHIEETVRNSSEHQSNDQISFDV